MSKWREYKVEDVFDVLQVKNKLENLDFLLDSGKYPVITQSFQNNQIDGYLDTFEETGNCLSYEFVAQGKVFYQEKEFSGVGSKIGIIRLKNKKKIERYLGLFLASIFNKNLKKYSYSYQRIPERLKSEIISLPSIIYEDGTFEPDWNYMETYMKNVEQEMLKENTKEIIAKYLDYKNGIEKDSIKIDIKKWREYKVEDIFDVSGIKRIEKPEEITSSKTKINAIALISQTAINNQLEGYCSSDIYEDANQITIDSLSTGKVFFQKDKFVAIKNQFNSRLKIKNRDMNQEIGRFLCAVLNSDLSKYSYNYQRSSTRLKSEIISLPSIIHEDGTFEPDWNYMETYMKELEKRMIEEEKIKDVIEKYLEYK